MVEPVLVQELQRHETRCHHFIENFLPIRQAYIFELINELERTALSENEVYTFKKSNEVLFPFPKVNSYNEQSSLDRNLGRFRSIATGRRTYLTSFWKSRVRKPPQVLHCHFLWMAHVLKDLMKIQAKKIVTAYGEDELFTGDTKDLQVAYDCSDLVLTTSTYLLELIKKHLGSSKKVRLWHIGIRTETNIHRTGSHNERPTILSVGRLIQRKGFINLVEAIPKVLQEVPKARFILIGEGGEEQVLKIRAKSLGISDSFEIIHKVDSLTDYYSKADLFVLPSIITQNGVTEGLGVPLLEAQAYGLPVIASNVGGIPDAVEDDKTGFLVKPNNSEILAEKILKLLNDNELYNRMSGKGSEKMKREFDLSTQSRIISAFYRDDS